MELSPKTKSAYFALYYGQKVLCIRPKAEPLLYVGFDDLLNNQVREDDYLLLTSLADITDEDFIGVARIMGYCDFEISPAFFSKEKQESQQILHGKSIIESFDGFKGGYPHIIYQYLQSKGYALPFHDLSVETMVEAGYIKLKTERENSKT